MANLWKMFHKTKALYGSTGSMDLCQTAQKGLYHVSNRMLDTGILGWLTVSKQRRYSIFFV